MKILTKTMKQSQHKANSMKSHRRPESEAVPGQNGQTDKTAESIWILYNCFIWDTWGTWGIRGILGFMPALRQRTDCIHQTETTVRHWLYPPDTLYPPTASNALIVSTTASSPLLPLKIKIQMVNIRKSLEPQRGVWAGMCVKQLTVGGFSGAGQACVCTTVNS